MFASVVIDTKNRELNETYDYIIPDDLAPLISIGSRVFVGFGSQKLLGYVLDIKDNSKYASKEILDVLDYDNELTTDQIELAKFISSEYYVSMTAVLELMIPSFLRGKERKKIVIKDYDLLHPDLAIAFNGKNNFIYTKDYLKYDSLIKKEIAKGNIVIDYDFYTYGHGMKKKIYQAVSDEGLKSAKRRIIYDYILNNDNAKEDDIVTYLDCSYSLLRDMVKKGNLKSKEVAISEDDLNIDTITRNTSPYSFSFDETQTLEKYDKSMKRMFLLHSNREEFKLNFYLHVIERCKKNNLPVMITSPTIMMSEEILMYLKRYLKGYNIYGVNSKNSTKERYEAFMNARYDNLDVLVCTHSGIFQPFNKLGAIIVLEEENPNYINENYPYYDTIRVLEERAKWFNADLILSSSSPSIDTYYNALNGKYVLMSSYDFNIGNMEIVDMHQEIMEGSSHIISNTLKEAIDNALVKNQQVMLQVYSKAYSMVMHCRKCGKVVMCPHCHLPLSLSKDKGYAKCSCCDYKAYDYNICTSCKSDDIIPLGFGEERVTEEITKMYPDVNVLNINADLMQRTEDYINALNQIEDGTYSIIIGTNIMSKTIKNDNIKVFGLIDIDMYLNSYNYHANEQTFNMISRLSNKDKAIIQTYYPNNKIINFATKLDFHGYYKYELENRNVLNNDPYYEVNKLLIKGDYKVMYHVANYFKKIFKNIVKDGFVLGPSYDAKAKAVKLIIKHNDFERLKKLILVTKDYFKKEDVLYDYQRCPKNV